jgi:hypothetical protein
MLIDRSILILAVQKERDRLGRQRNTNNTYAYRTATVKSAGYLTDNHNQDEDDLSVMSLYRAEQTAKEVEHRYRSNARQLSDVFF